MNALVQEVKRLHQSAELLERQAQRLRQQAATEIAARSLCAQGGDPASRGRGFCCQQPYDCLGRQP